MKDDLEAAGIVIGADVSLYIRRFNDHDDMM